MKQESETLGLPILTLTFRIVLGVIFIYASLDKIQFPADFAIAVQNYQILPDVLTNLVAIILPWLELLCGLCLLSGLFLRESSSILAALLLIFIIALIAALVRGLDINCGCYGLDTQIGWGRILEDIGLLFMALYVSFFPRSPFALERITSLNLPVN